MILQSETDYSLSGLGNFIVVLTLQLSVICCSRKSQSSEDLLKIVVLDCFFLYADSYHSISPLNKDETGRGNFIVVHTL